MVHSDQVDFGEILCTVFGLLTLVLTVLSFSLHLFLFLDHLSDTGLFLNIKLLLTDLLMIIDSFILSFGDFTTKVDFKIGVACWHHVVSFVLVRGQVESSTSSGRTCDACRYDRVLED